MSSIAQYYARAELHFLDGTKTFGLAHINTFNDKIKFKKHKDDKRISYNHKDVSRLVLRRDTIKKEFRYKKTLGRRAPRLLELIIEDKNISLYAEITEVRMYGLIGALLKVPNQFIYIYYIVKEDANKAIYFGDTELTAHKRFKEITKKHLKGCDEVLIKVKNREYKVKNSQEVVRHYNKKCTKDLKSNN
tara:strand:+ start:694 stop:1263 length:570 start_codon:yes stop_codon:yes gene_type:complete